MFGYTVLLSASAAATASAVGRALVAGLGFSASGRIIAGARAFGLNRTASAFVRGFFAFEEIDDLAEQAGLFLRRGSSTALATWTIGIAAVALQGKKGICGKKRRAKQEKNAERSHREQNKASGDENQW